MVAQEGGGPAERGEVPGEPPYRGRAFLIGDAALFLLAFHPEKVLPIPSVQDRVRRPQLVCLPEGEALQQGDDPVTPRTAVALAGGILIKALVLPALGARPYLLCGHRAKVSVLFSGWPMLISLMPCLNQKKGKARNWHGEVKKFKLKYLLTFLSFWIL